MSEHPHIECPCCGDVGAVPDILGRYHDGQPLLCGCEGCVSFDSETEPGITVDCLCEYTDVLPGQNPWPAVWSPSKARYIAVVVLGDE